MAELDGLPDVDLGSVVDDLKQQEKDAEVKEKKVNADRNELGQFKSKEDLLKSYKEIQGAYTTTTQRVKEIEAENKRLQEELELNQGAQSQYEMHPTNDRMQSDYEDPEIAVARQVNATLISLVLQEEQGKN